MKICKVPLKKETYGIVLCMLIGMGLHLIRIGKMVPMACPSDELGAMVSAATLAGYDWSGVIHGSGYYGFGFYSLFFWVFKLFDSPYIIYKIYIFAGMLCRILIMPIAFYIMKHYMKVESKITLYGVSFFSAFLYSSTAHSISNDFALELLIWVTVLLVLKYVEYSSNNGLKKVLYMVLLLLDCFYIQLIHTRALVLLIALFLTIIALHFWLKQKNPILPIGIIASYFGAKCLINFYQSQIWNMTGGEIRNGSATVSSIINIFDKNTWSLWFHMLIGMLGTQTILTGGLFVLTIVVIVHYLVSILQKRELVNYYIIATVIMLVLAIGGTLASFFVSGWFEGMYTYWGTELLEECYAYKGMLYVRYWGVFFPPLAMIALSIMNKENAKTTIRYTSIFICILIVLFCEFVIPIVKNQASASGFLYTVGMYRKGMTISEEFYFKAVVIGLIGWLIYLVLSVCGKYYERGLLVLTVFLVFVQINKFYFYDPDVHKNLEKRVNASYAMINEMEKSNVEIGEIYVYDDTSFTDYNANKNSILQFFFWEYTIREDIPEKLEENDVIITKRHIWQYADKYPGIHCYDLDENECWYTYMDLN